MPQASASWEDARRCPRCQEPGKFIADRPLPSGGSSITLRCPNERCKWFDTDWAVQKRPDGSIPVADTSPLHVRQLPDDGGRTEEILRRQLEAMKRGGAEMPGRG